jgi:glycosyltransferase involved in cell wall biosynthesis
VTQARGERLTEQARIAVLIPCHNEAQSVGAVVTDFRAALPGCDIVVADNASTDETAAVARAAGARVITVSRRGKGMAVRQLFADVDADCYLLVDGDATYEACAAPRLARLVLEGGLDMVNAERITPEAEQAAYRRGHRIGNTVLTWIFRQLFELPLTDTLTGYRAFSRRFVKSFPAASEGFEIEAELNAHAAVLGVPVGEVPTVYVARPAGSTSKLNTYADGLRILRRNLRLFRDARPSRSFNILAAPWLLVSVALVWAPVKDYLGTGNVAHFPSLIAGVGTFLVALNLWASGIVLERVFRNRVEVVRLSYLSIPVEHWGPMDVPPSAPRGRATEPDVPAATPRTAKPLD